MIAVLLDLQSRKKDILYLLTEQTRYQETKIRRLFNRKLTATGYILETACAGHFPLIARRNWRIMSMELCSTVPS